ncbi:unnamed protein product [Arabis nemorensis]|uniref:Uncharacterized protein n=1 Tax=Arabis nemorensis TaxID=586526 RepID=A0A565C3R2_9BRAS|nr:unnamed protein product [Arabis nemorensis]
MNEGNMGIIVKLLWCYKTWTVDALLSTVRKVLKYDHKQKQTMDELKDFSRVSPAVQNHLKRVYLSLFCILVASAFGAYLHMLWNIGGMITTLGWVVSTLEHFHSCPPHEHQMRFSLLFLFGLLQGDSIGPLIKSAIDIDPRCFVVPFLPNTRPELCLAMLARRREYLYLGGMLSSGLSMLALLRTSEFASSSVEFQLVVSYNFYFSPFL